LEATDLIEVSTIESGSYVTRSITGQELIDAIPLPPTGLTVGTTPISSGTIGRVLFQGTGNVLQQSGNLAWNNTNNQFSLLTNSDLASSALSGLSVKNSNSTGYANTLWYNNNDDVGQFMMTGTSGAISGTNIIARQANFINAGGTGGINLLATAGHITFLAGSGSTSKMVLFQTGNLAINTTTDAGFRLDVNGTARVTTLTTTNLHSPSGTEIIFIRNSGGTTAGRIFPDGSTFRMSSASGLNSLGIYNSGNIGINTTTDAGFKLDVNGTARFSGGVTGIVGSQTSVSFGVNGLANGMYNPGGNSLGFSTNSAARIYLDASNMNLSVPLCVSGSVATSPNASAQLDVNSTTKGFLPPRQTQAQRTAIASPSVGLIVYQTDLVEGLYIYKSTGWTFVI
jgi:hypothetical protein